MTASVIFPKGGGVFRSLDDECNIGMDMCLNSDYLCQASSTRVAPIRALGGNGCLLLHCVL